MGRTVNLATVWGACATEKGRQFRQMSTDLSEFFPMSFCIEERVAGTAMSQATRSAGARHLKHFFEKKIRFYCWNSNTTELWFKKNQPTPRPAKQSKAKPQNIDSARPVIFRPFSVGPKGRVAPAPVL
jgi:hypothetical protein